MTLIEVLVATAILGVLIGSLVGPLGGLFRMTKRNQQLLDNTTIAQQAMEKIIRDWQDVDYFSRSCLDSGTVLPSGVSVEIMDLNANADAISPYYSLRSCTVSADSVPLKRVKITANQAGGVDAVVVLDIARPQP